jgi:CCR4-NOT transcription complex subunit 7/8
MDGSDDMFVPDHLDNIQKSSNIDLQRHEELGILPQDFAEMMITSGLVLTEEPKWISFHRYVNEPCFHFIACF